MTGGFRMDTLRNQITSFEAVPSFDAGPDARPLFKERVLWALLLGLFFFLVYLSCNEISALRAPHPSFYWDWELHIPFVPEFILPYMSSDFVFVVAFLVAPRRVDLQKLGLRLGLAIVISAAFFIVMPLQFSFPRPEVSGWPAAWFGALGFDKPYNQFPSLHISLGFLAWLEIRMRVRGAVGWLVSLWFLAIAASTLLVYQHHAIDLIGAAAVTAFLFKAIPPDGQGRVPLRFVTPRHLHLALRYLIAASLAVLAAFHAGFAGAVLFGWVAVSLVSVSCAYGLGVNEILGKTAKGYPPFRLVLFLPYLVGSWLNWKFWRARVPLMSEVVPGVWIGARPAAGDLPRLREAGIRAVIDLAPELPAVPLGNLEYRHMPLLDMTIPDPAVLVGIVSRIDAAARGGGVYIHCALGMSRSVLAVCAWLVASGSTPAEALARIDRVRLRRVRRPYMAIALELYERCRVPRHDDLSAPLGGGKDI